MMALTDYDRYIEPLTGVIEDQLFLSGMNSSAKMKRVAQGAAHHIAQEAFSMVVDDEFVLVRRDDLRVVLEDTVCITEEWIPAHERLTEALAGREALAPPVALREE